MSASNLWNTRLVTGAMRAVRPRKTKRKLPPPVNKMGRAKGGLFANKATGTGNNVSFSKRRTKRTFKPNVVKATLYSEALESTIKLKCTTAALRRIDKYGGLDNYITKSPISHLRESDLAQALRYRILKAQAEARGEVFDGRADFAGEAAVTLEWRAQQLRKTRESGGGVEATVEK